MSNPIAGYAVMPIIPSLRGLDAEINRQLSSSTAVAAAGQKAGAAYSDGFAQAGAAGAAGLATGLFGREASEAASSAGTQVGAEFSAAVVTQLATLPKAQADALRKQLQSQSAAAALAGRSWGEKFRDGMSSGIGDLNNLGIDSGSLTSFGTKAVLVGGLAAVGLGKAAKAAGDLNAAVSTSEQVFGSAAGEIERWSQDSADSIYLSQRAALEAATSFGAFGKSAGLAGPELSSFSTDLAGLAADLAAFKNTSPEDALAALQSGLAGESEPLRRYQILLSDAQLKQEALRLGIIDTTTNALTPQQRVLAANASIWAQSTDIIGQAAREYDEVGSQINRAKANMEDASAALGEALAPILAAGAGGIADISGAFQALDNSTQGVAAGVAGVLTTLTLMGGGASLAAGGVMRLSDGYQRLKTNANSNNAALARSAATGKLAAKALGAAGLAFAVYELGSALNEGSRDVLEFDTALKQMTLAGDDQVGSFLKRQSEALEGGGDKFSDLMNSIYGDNADPSVKLQGAVIELDNLKKVLAKLRDEDPQQLARVLDALGDAKPVKGDDALVMEKLGKIVADYTENLDANNDVLDEQTQKQDDAKTAADALAKAVGTLTTRTSLASLEFDAAAAGAAAFSSAMERAQSADNLLKASLGVSSAMRDLREGFFGEADAAEEASSATDTLSDALDRMNRELAYSDPSLTAAAIGLGRLAAAGSAFRDSMSNNAYASQIGSALDLGDAFRDFSKQMRRLPDEIDTAGAALGKYRPRQTEAIRSMLALGEATSDYLAGLLESGKGSAAVRSEADRLRDAYIAQFRAAGKTEDQIRKYIEALGLTPEQVETSIRLSGVEAARFEIQSYLQLLEGRIPESIAASVTAKISSGNLEAAAAELAALAVSNPVVIPVDIDSDKLSKAKEELLELPKTLDPLGSIFGGYTEAEERGLEKVLTLGDNVKTLLSEMVAAGRGEEALGLAANIRTELEKQFAQYGITGGAFDEYADKLLGLSIPDLKVAIDMASFESDVFKVQTLLGLLEADLTSEERFAVAASIREGDIDAALWMLNDKVTEWEKNQKGLSILPNFEEATTATTEWVDNLAALRVPVEADTTLAFEGVEEWRSQVIGGKAPGAPVDADMDPATKGVQSWADVIEASIPTKTKVDADTFPAFGTVNQFGQDISNLPPFQLGMDVDTKPATNTLRRWFDNLPGLNFAFQGAGLASGGLVRGPGTSTSDSIPALLSNGEYVLNAAAVQDIGVDTLNRLNARQFDTLRPNELNVSTSGEATGAGVNLGGVHYHQVEVAPTPRDLVRGVDDELVVLTGRRFGG